MLEAFKRWIARGKDSAAERAARISGDVTSASVGGLTGLVLAGPPGIVAGAAVASVLKEAIKSALDRAATQRAVTVFTLASKRICAERESGKQLRADGFFDDSVSGRSAAADVLEQIMQAVQQESEERKLPFIASLYASIAFREDVDRGMANLLVRTAEQLSYRQLCLLSVFMDRGAHHLRTSDYINAGDREQEPAMPRVVGLDVPVLDRGHRQATVRAAPQQRLDDRARVLAQVAARAAVEDEVGEGIGHARHCRRVRGKAPATWRAP